MLPVTTIKWIRNPDGSPGFEWNPVVGCNRQCPDCNAKLLDKAYFTLLAGQEKEWHTGRRQTSILSRQFQNIMQNIANLNNFIPAFLYSRHQIDFPFRPAGIIVNTISDINYWQFEWMDVVLRKIKLFSDHTFFFLTKNINTYRQYIFPPNAWLGVVVDSSERLLTYEKVYQNTYKSDPLARTNSFFFVIRSLEAIEVSPIYYMARWIILDIETHTQVPDAVRDKNIEPVINHYHNKIKIVFV